MRKRQVITEFKSSYFEEDVMERPLLRGWILIGYHLAMG